MEKIGILVDTTSDLDLAIQDSQSVKIVPLQIIFNDGRTFRDLYEISYDEVMDSLDEFETKTSLPVAQEAIDALNYFVKEEYTHLFAINLSSGLSGTYNMIKTISAEYQDKLVIEVVDTKLVTWGNGHLVMGALEMIAQGESFDNISKMIRDKMTKRDIFFAVESLKYLIRGGRISKLSGTVGEALDIKPIITLDQEGKLVAKDKVRGRKKSIAKIVQLVQEAAQGKAIEKIYVLHGNREDEALFLKNKLMDEFDAPIDIEALGALVSVHAGPGLVGAVVMYK